VIEARAYPQNPVFEAALQFTRTEGILPAPEAAHAIRAAVDEALQAREEGRSRTILFELSGHGHFDLASYDRYLAGELQDFALPESEIDRAMAAVPNV
jgi:tryptophan synthase beta chain